MACMADGFCDVSSADGLNRRFRFPIVLYLPQYPPISLRATRGMIKVQKILPSKSTGCVSTRRLLPCRVAKQAPTKDLRAPRPENVPGEFSVDHTCIGDILRQHFGASGLLFCRLRHLSFHVAKRLYTDWKSISCLPTTPKCRREIGQHASVAFLSNVSLLPLLCSAEVTIVWFVASVIPST